MLRALLPRDLGTSHPIRAQLALILCGALSTLGVGACSSSPTSAGGNGGSEHSDGGAASASGGAAGASGGGAATASGGAAGASDGDGRFSFFVTSVGAMKALSGNALGFGGDLRFGETGDGAGLRGADKICATIAETALPGSNQKTWRAFLSAKSAGPSGAPVHAKDRIGQGPWYDRLGRLVAPDLESLLHERPVGGDSAIADDLPNENGVPNHQDGAPGCTGNACPDNHDTLTGSAADGTLYTKTTNATCSDWTSARGTAGQPRCGHSWPRSIAGTPSLALANWISALDEAGCAPGINLVEMGPPNAADASVGSGGGYGGIYCFALSP